MSSENDLQSSLGGGRNDKSMEAIYHEAVARLEALFRNRRIPASREALADDCLLRLRRWNKEVLTTPDWEEELSSHYPDEASGVRLLLRDVASPVEQMANSLPEE